MRPVDGLLELQGVELRYGEQGRPVLSGLDLAVARGEWVSLLGPSGCGKTSLLHLAAGFLRPTIGRVLFMGRPVAGPGPERAMVFQEPTLFPWLTAYGNVAFGLRRRGLAGEALRRAALAALAAVDMAEAADKRPFSLSGGMRQRVALARALALDPSLLLLDEPFAALDLALRERLQDLALEVWGQGRRTVVCVTHNVAEAAYLGGRILVFGPGGQRPAQELRVPSGLGRNAPQTRELEGRLRELVRQNDGDNL